MSMKPEDNSITRHSPCHAQHGCIRAFEDDTCGDEGQCTIARAIMAAVEEEREACVAIARHYDGLGRQPSEGAAYGDASLTQLDIASIIRTRSNSD